MRPTCRRCGAEAEPVSWVVFRLCFGCLRGSKDEVRASAETVARCLRELREDPGPEKTAEILETARRHLLVLSEFDDVAPLLGGRAPSEILRHLERWVGRY